MYEEMLLEQIKICEERQRDCGIVDIDEFIKYGERLLSLAKAFDDFQLNKVFKQPSFNCRHRFEPLSKETKDNVENAARAALLKE